MSSTEYPFLEKHFSPLSPLADPPTTKLNNPLAVSAQTSSEGFTKILNQIDTNLPDEQKNRLKVAFAEGYLAANNSEGGAKGGKTMKYLKVREMMKFL